MHTHTHTYTESKRVRKPETKNLQTKFVLASFWVPLQMAEQIGRLQIPLQHATRIQITPHLKVVDEMALF